MSCPSDGRQRVIIEGVSPEIDGGRFPVKRVLGEQVAVEADVFADGHEVLSAVVKFRHESEPSWSEAPLNAGVNDRWRGVFTVSKLGLYIYTFEGWVNHFRSWQRDLEKKFAAGQEVFVELLAGRELIQDAWERVASQNQVGAPGHGTHETHRINGTDEPQVAHSSQDQPRPDALELKTAAEALAPDNPSPQAAKVGAALSQTLAGLMDTWSERLHVARYLRELRVRVDPVLARFGAWYELFPRSSAPEPGRHGTLRDCAARLPRLAAMGFDVVYLAPIHPIGHAFRKGRNNSLTVTPEDPGSPWAIGSAEGGHKAIHPQLGTFEDFQALVQKARDLRLEVALDIAFQCSPDHPYVREHPQWFKHRPDGSIQYAENPPKRYQDIYPLDFETEDWRALWTELKSVFEFWIGHGVRVFRVDNPHTKPFRFWAWCLGSLKQAHPELIFLSEAFTRPKVMYCLAKLGFTQSYNYFPWRNTKHELTKYLTELTQTRVREFFRPNLWPNTPDILTQYLQFGGRPALVSRLILAATLGASYGVYGPPYETGETQPREPGSEEYLNSEKYEIRHWDLSMPGGLGELMARINQIRRDNPALQCNESLQFHEVDNDQIIAYSKHTVDYQNLVLTIVNLDPRHTQRGWVRLAPARWGLDPGGTYQVHELLTNERYLWSGERNYVELNPVFVPAHLFRLRRHVRTEQDFDYFL